MCKYFFFLLFFSVSFWGISQNSNIRDVYQAYYKNADEEALFLHLNKTTYLIGEEIWFKSYIISKRNDRLSRASSNLYVGLYDCEGKQVSQKLVQIINGKAHGNILLSDSIASGMYSIKAATQPMIDTNPTDAFIQELIIYGESPIVLDQKTDAAKYDLQFLPEGGYLLSDVENTVAFKVTNQNGQGVSMTGSLLDAQNNVLTTFESNPFGMGTFQFTPKNNQHYTAKVLFEELTEHEQLLPKAEATGIAIQVNNLQKDSIHISFSTNKATLPQIASKTYTLFVHREGFARSMSIDFQNETKVTLKIPRKHLFHGVHTITLFDGKIPLIERLFFNRKIDKKLGVAIEKVRTEADSTEFSLFLVKGKQGILDANVSISILPETTEAYQPAHSIYSSLYLKPYVRGAIENPKYYFPNSTITRRKDLDALLITQGWSKYDWTKIFQDKPLEFSENNGMVIRGKINHPKKGVESVFLHDTKNTKAQSIPIDDEQQFVIHNLYPEANEKLRFSYIDRKKRFLKPKLYVQYNIKEIQDEIDERFAIDRLFEKPSTSFKLPYGFFPKDAVALNAVILEGSNQKEQKEATDPMMVRGKETKIGIEEYLRYPQVKDIIMNSGYDVTDDPLSMNGVFIHPRKRLTLEGNPISPLVFIDDVQITDFSILRDFSTAQVERVVVDKSGLGYGVRGVGGVIKIYSRKTPLTATTTTREDAFAEITPPIGFTKPKEYYVPKYPSFSSPTYQKYGAIDWKPNVIIPRRGSFDFILKHQDVQGVMICIEGISIDGSLISLQRIISLDKEEQKKK